MRTISVVGIAVGLLGLGACTDGDDGFALDPPTCLPDGKVRFIHTIGGTEVTGELASGSYGFINKISDDDPGYLDIGDVGGRQGTNRIYVAFEKLIAKGGSAAAQGFFKIDGLQAGNCESTQPSRIVALQDEGWTVQLEMLHEAPYCEGAAIDGAFSACLIPEPF